MKRGKPRPNWYESGAWCYYAHMQRMCGTQPIARMLQKQGCPVEVALVFLAGRPNAGVAKLAARFITLSVFESWTDDQKDLVANAMYYQPAAGRLAA
jgi:hypothetical protein